MKFLSFLSFFTLTVLSSLAQGPATWDQNTAYTHPALVLNGSTTYISLQDVPSGTAITSSTYWSTLDSQVPTTTPTGAESLTTPDASEVSNLSAPSTTNAAKLKGISTNATVTPSALMVAGVTITGGTKKVVFQVQATGTYASTDGYLQDPILYIVNGLGAVVATVDNWQNGPDAGYDASLYSTSYLSELQNSSYAMAGANESAIIMNLPEGSYTALVGSKSGAETAKAVVAAFDFEE